MPEWKDTVKLPRTEFPMKAGLPEAEPKWLKRWEEMGLYRKLRENAQGAPLYVLHDGPPYANGDIHIGTALNTILKDFVVRSRQMLGFNAPYVPGWDCHGLPIEWKIEEEYRAKGKSKDEVPVNELRAECRAFPLSLRSRRALSARRRPLSPHPQVSHDFYRRRDDQHAKGRLRHRLHRPLDQHAVDHTTYDDDHREGHVSDAPLSQSQSSADCGQKRDGEDCPHDDHTEGGERRRRCEEKGVDHVRRTGDPKAADVDQHRHDQRASAPVMCTPPTISRQSR